MNKTLLYIIICAHFLFAYLITQTFLMSGIILKNDYQTWYIHSFLKEKQYQYIVDRLADSLYQNRKNESIVYLNSLMNFFDPARISTISFIHLLSALFTQENFKEDRAFLVKKFTENSKFTDLKEFIDPAHVINDLYFLDQSKNFKNFKLYFEKVKVALDIFYNMKFEIYNSCLKNKDCHLFTHRFLEPFFLTEKFKRIEKKEVENKLAQTWSQDEEDFDNPFIKGFFVSEAASLIKLSDKIKIINFSKKTFQDNFSAAVFLILEAIYYLKERSVNPEIQKYLSDFITQNRKMILKNHFLSIKDNGLKGFKKDAIDEAVRMLTIVPIEDSIYYLPIPLKFYLEDPSFRYREKEIRKISDQLFSKLDGSLYLQEDSRYLVTKMYYSIYSGKVKEADSIYNEGIKKKHRFNQQQILTYCKGRFYPSRNHDFSITCLENSLKYASNIVDFENYSIYGNIGEEYNEMGNLIKAKEYFLKSKVITDKKNILFACTHRGLGLVFLKENKLESAESFFKELIRVFPFRATNYIFLSVINFKRNEPDKALDILSTGCKLKKNPEEFFPAFENENIKLTQEQKDVYKTQLLKLCNLP